jgi:D-alanyl-D-alanine carboxypeptidase
MLRRRSLLLVVLLLVATASARADRVDDFVAAQMARFHVPGLSMAVVRDGDIVKAKGYGVANRARRTPMTPDTILKIGSVSKQFIASGIMLLVEARQLRLDDPVSTYLEGTPPSWSPITIRHLLTHTSGIVREAPGFDPFKVQSDADVIRTAYSLPLRFAPGAKWEYCNVGYFALAEIIRKVSGQPWPDYLHAKVFQPSGMTATHPTNTTLHLEPRAVGYNGDDNSREAPEWTALRPSGAFLSTVLDIAKWDRMLYSDKVLGARSKRLMSEPVGLSDGTTHPYGFGWELSSVDGHPEMRHGGSLPGFRAGLARYVDDRLTVVVLMNGEDMDVDAIVRGIARLYFEPGRADSKGQGKGDRRRNGRSEGRAVGRR